MCVRACYMAYLMKVYKLKLSYIIKSINDSIEIMTESYEDVNNFLCH